MDYSPNIRLRYGKHAGWKLSSLPEAYIKWCLDNKGKKRGPGQKLAFWCKKERERRGEPKPQRRPKRMSTEQIFESATILGIDNGLISACESEMFPSSSCDDDYGDY